MNEEKPSKLKQACIASYTEWSENLEISEDEIQYSDRHKKRINRIAREILKNEKPIYPEVDNAFERTRSKVVVWWKSQKNNGKD